MWADDALSAGLIDQWFDDGVHASAQRSYLSALVLFGTLTGLDPARFGMGEIAARELGVGRRSARILQRVATDQLGFAAPAPVPLPASGALIALAVAMPFWAPAGRLSAAAATRPRPASPRSPAGRASASLRHAREKTLLANQDA